MAALTFDHSLLTAHLRADGVGVSKHVLHIAPEVMRLSLSSSYEPAI